MEVIGVIGACSVYAQPFLDANDGDWGIVDENGLHTGYFYLSYYDEGISAPESFRFDLPKRVLSAVKNGRRSAFCFLILKRSSSGSRKCRTMSRAMSRAWTGWQT